MALSARQRTIVKVAAFLLSLLIPTAAGLWPFWRQSDKALEYAITSLSPLGPTQASGFRDLQLLKGKEVIDQPYLATVRIINVGAVPIVPADFATPINIRTATIPGKTFTQDEIAKLGLGRYPWIDFKLLKSSSTRTVVVDARVSRASPPNLAPRLKIAKDIVEVAPLLLNAGDEIEIELLLSGGVPIIDAESRIAGVQAIARQPTDSAQVSKVRMTVDVMRIVLLIALSYLFWMHGVHRLGNSELWFFRRPVATILFLLCVVVAVPSYSHLATAFQIETKWIAGLLLMGGVLLIGTTMVVLSFVLGNGTRRR